MGRKTRIAIAVGNPARIGPEISFKTALDPSVRAICDPILFADPALLARHAYSCGCKLEIRPTGRIEEADWSNNRLNVLTCTELEMANFVFGVESASNGHASLDFANAAIRSARAGEVDAVAAAPYNFKSIAGAGVKFNGYPSFVARKRGTDENEVLLMTCLGCVRIVHATLHISVRDAVAAITRERVLRAVRTTDLTLRLLAIATPKIVVGGLNPLAGAAGLLGHEGIEIIKPAIDAAAAQGTRVLGPYPANSMFLMQHVDAFIVMIHGQIAAKALAQSASSALTIGTPILFSSAEDDSANDIAGSGHASPDTMIRAITILADANRNASMAC